MRRSLQAHSTPETERPQGVLNCWRTDSGTAVKMMRSQRSPLDALGEDCAGPREALCEEINSGSGHVSLRKYGASAELCFTAQPGARVRYPGQQRYRCSTDSRAGADVLNSTRRWIVCHSRTKAHLRDPKGQRHLCHSITGTGTGLPYADNTAAVLCPRALLGIAPCVRRNVSCQNSP